MENEKNMTCVEDLGERTGNILRINRTRFNWKEDKIIPEPGRWHRRFDYLHGWFYVRNGTKSMKDSHKDIERIYNNLMVELMDNTTVLNVIIHDVNEYPLNINSLKTITFKEMTGVYIRIRRVEMVTNCEKKKDYSFTMCIENFISKKIGCKMTWSYGHVDYPLCNVSGLKDYAKFKMLNIDMKRIPDITNITGCKPNCVNYKYDIMNIKPIWAISGKEIILTITWLKNELIVETEKLAYDELTFVANFGGALGLFVGFSFFMLWDLMIMILNMIKTKFTFK